MIIIIFMIIKHTILNMYTFSFSKEKKEKRRRTEWKQRHLNLHFDQFVCITHSLCVSISLELLSKQHPFNLQSVSFRCLFIFSFFFFFYLYHSLFMINTHLICKVSRARRSTKQKNYKFYFKRMGLSMCLQLKKKKNFAYKSNHIESHKYVYV